MGMLVDPQCRSCGHAWSGELLDGTMLVGIYRCLRCGTSATIGAPELDAAGLFDEGPWSLSKAKVLAVIGTCDCGGAYSRKAPVRCPLCRSKDVDLGDALLMVD